MAENVQIFSSTNLVENHLLETDNNLLQIQPQSENEKNSEIWAYIHISIFAIFGCLIRLGTDHVMGKTLQIEDTNSIIYESFFSNILGSFLLGILMSSDFKTQLDFKHLYVGITTGMCGSITTYSKWNQQVSMLLIGENGTSITSQFTAIGAIYVGVVVFLSSFQCGGDILQNADKTKEKSKCSFRPNSSKLKNRTNYVSLILLLLCFISIVSSCIFLNKNTRAYTILLTAIFAPFGAMLRFILGKLNGRFPMFISNKIVRQLPLGTLAANFVGSFFMSITHVTLSWGNMDCSAIAIFRAVQGGFIGCLTTVSTFIAEVSSLRNHTDRPALFVSYVYIAITFTLCQLIACLTNGVSYVLLKNNKTYNMSSIDLLHSNCY